MGGEGKIVPNNTHFDTTRANVEISGAQALDFPVPESLEPALNRKFKGNMDIRLKKSCRLVALMDITVDN
jgi:tryptophanase